MRSSFAPSTDTSRPSIVLVASMVTLSARYVVPFTLSLYELGFVVPMPTLPVKLGEALKTAAPVPTSSETRPANEAEVKASILEMTWACESSATVTDPFAAIEASPPITTGLKLVSSPTNTAPAVFVVINKSSPDIVRSPDMVRSSDISTLVSSASLIAPPESVRLGITTSLLETRP